MDFQRLDISKIATATFPTVSTGLVKPHLTAHLQSVLKDVIFQLLQFNISPTDLVFFAGFQVQMFLVGGFNPSEKYARQIGHLPR